MFHQEMALLRLARSAGVKITLAGRHQADAVEDALGLRDAGILVAALGGRRRGGQQHFPAFGRPESGVLRQQRVQKGRSRARQPQDEDRRGDPLPCDARHPLAVIDQPQPRLRHRAQAKLGAGQRAFGQLRVGHDRIAHRGKQAAKLRLEQFGPAPVRQAGSMFCVGQQRVRPRHGGRCRHYLAALPTRTNLLGIILSTASGLEAE